MKHMSEDNGVGADGKIQLTTDESQMGLSSGPTGSFEGQLKTYLVVGNAGVSVAVNVVLQAASLEEADRFAKEIVEHAKFKIAAAPNFGPEVYATFVWDATECVNLEFEELPIDYEPSKLD